MTFLLWFSIKYDEKVNWRRAIVWCILFIVTGYGAVDEIVQSYIGRICDVRDIVANSVGVLTGLFIFSFFAFWPSALIVSGLTIFGITNIARANIAELFPITNIFFHLFAYAVFTALWIQNMHLIKHRKVSGTKWLIQALTLPAVFLLTVKIFTAILGKGFAVSDIIASLGAIITVVAVIYIRALFGKTPDFNNKGQ